MYKIGDRVMHKSAGVCVIEDIHTQKFSRLEKKLYYVLKPVGEKNARIFFPADTDNGTLRSLKTKSDINSILSDVRNENSLWISDEKARNRAFGEILKSGDHVKIIKMVSELRSYKLSAKKLHAADERILDEAQRLIGQEFAYSLGISPEAAAQYIISHIEG